MDPPPSSSIRLSILSLPLANPKKFSPKLMLILVGIVLTLTSIYSLLRAVHVL